MRAVGSDPDVPVSELLFELPIQEMLYELFLAGALGPPAGYSPERLVTFRVARGAARRGFRQAQES